MLQWRKEGSLPCVASASAGSGSFLQPGCPTGNSVYARGRSQPPVAITSSYGEVTYQRRSKQLKLEGLVVHSVTD